MFMCAVNRKSVNKLDLTWKQSFLILVDSNFSDEAPCTSLIDFSEETTTNQLYTLLRRFNTVNIEILK
jgi:hypothetical protein